MPTGWTYSHFLFNYEWGFCKRGLIGEILRQLDWPALTSYQFFLSFHLLLFIITLGVLLSLLKTMIDSNQRPLQLAMLLYVSSVAIPMMANTIAYADHIGLLLTLIILKTRPGAFKLGLSALGFCFALLIHEVNAILFLPLLAISLFIDSQQSDTPKWQLIFTVLIITALALLSLFMTQALLSAEANQSMGRALSVKVGIALRVDAFATLSRSFMQNFTLISSNIAPQKSITAYAHSLIVTLPTSVILILMASQYFKSLSLPRLLRALAVLAPLSPLLLHSVAWDYNRWNALVITLSFLLLYDGFRRNKPLKLSPFWYRCEPLFYFMLFLNGASSLLLLNRTHLKQFPFLISS